MAQFNILEENRGTDKNSASGQLSALFAAGRSLFPVGLNAWVRVGGTESIYNRILRQSYGPCSAGWTLVLPFLEFPCRGGNLTPQHFCPLQQGRLEAEMLSANLTAVACSRLWEVQFSASRGAKTPLVFCKGSFLGRSSSRNFSD